MSQQQPRLSRTSCYRETRRRMRTPKATTTLMMTTMAMGHVCRRMVQLHNCSRPQMLAQCRTPCSVKWRARSIGTLAK